MTVDVMFCDADVGDGSHVRDVGISTVPDTRRSRPVDDRPIDNVVGQ